MRHSSYAMHANIPAAMSAAVPLSRANSKTPATMKASDACQSRLNSNASPFTARISEVPTLAATTPGLPLVPHALPMEWRTKLSSSVPVMTTMRGLRGKRQSFSCGPSAALVPESAVPRPGLLASPGSLASPSMVPAACHTVSRARARRATAATAAPHKDAQTRSIAMPPQSQITPTRPIAASA